MAGILHSIISSFLSQLSLSVTDTTIKTGTCNFTHQYIAKMIVFNHNEKAYKPI